MLFRSCVRSACHVLTGITFVGSFVLQAADSATLNQQGGNCSSVLLKWHIPDLWAIIFLDCLLWQPSIANSLLDIHRLPWRRRGSGRKRYNCHCSVIFLLHFAGHLDLRYDIKQSKPSTTQSDYPIHFIRFSYITSNYCLIDEISWRKTYDSTEIQSFFYCYDSYNKYVLYLSLETYNNTIPENPQNPGYHKLRTSLAPTSVPNFQIVILYQ